MAKATSSSATDGGAEESLLDFSFDNGDFFGIKAGTIKSEGKIESKTPSRTGDDFDDDQDDGKVTSLEPKKDAKGKTSTKKAKDDGDDDEEDEELEDSDFFQSEGTKKEVKKEAPVKKAEKTEKTTTTKDDDDEVEDEDDDEDDKVEDGKDKDDDEETEDEVYDALALELVDEGVFATIELPKGEKVTRDKFFVHLNEEIDARVEETITALIKDMDDEGKAFIKFKQNGGDTRQFLNQYGGSLGLEELDEDKPEQVSRVLEYYLRTYEKLDDEELAERLEYIKNGGKEKANAKRWYATISKDDKERKDAVIKIQQKAFDDRKKQAEDFADAIEDTLSKTEKIKGFAISKGERKTIAAFINKASVKVGPNKFLPPMLAEIQRMFKGAKEEDRKDLILLAKVIEAKFDISDTVAAVNTKVIARAKSKIAEAKKGNQRLSGSLSGGSRSLADMID